MEWLTKIEARASLVPNHTGAWSDVRKLIAVVKVAEKALLKAKQSMWDHTWGDKDPHDTYEELSEALAQLQSGEFGEADSK